MYDEKHRFNVLSIDPEQENRLKQKGLWDRLLCDQCEILISRWERYASLVLGGGISLEVENVGRLIRVTGIDYKSFKLFQLSILWRAGVSNERFFENVALGPHEEVIRKMLLKEDPGQSKLYGCAMFGIRHGGKALVDLIMQPGRIRVQGQVAYRFIFGGFLWCFFVASAAPPKPLPEAFVNESGTLVILPKDAADAENLVMFGRELSRLGRSTG